MKSNYLETGTNVPENISKEELEEKLSVLNEKYNQLLGQAPKFYDQELCDLFIKAARKSGGDLELMTMLLNAKDYSYESALENYNKFENFKSQYLKPLETEKENIIVEINKINNTELEQKRKQASEEEEKNFQTEKDALTNPLYEALDFIHSKIPKEASEVGMNSAMALKTYLPELVHEAERIERYVKRLESAISPSEILRIKRDIERDTSMDGILG